MAPRSESANDARHTHTRTRENKPRDRPPPSLLAEAKHKAAPVVKGAARGTGAAPPGRSRARGSAA
eukprot:8328635-Alexandrium_andersonii.AAC.1